MGKEKGLDELLVELIIFLIKYSILGYTILEIGHYFWSH